MAALYGAPPPLASPLFLPPILPVCSPAALPAHGRQRGQRGRGVGWAGGCKGKWRQLGRVHEAGHEAGQLGRPEVACCDGGMGRPTRHQGTGSSPMSSPPWRLLCSRSPCSSSARWRCASAAGRAGGRLGKVLNSGAHVGSEQQCGRQASNAGMQQCKQRMRGSGWAGSEGG